MYLFLLDHTPLIWTALACIANCSAALLCSRGVLAGALLQVSQCCWIVMMTGKILLVIDTWRR
ncbi:hypothetical protein [Xylella fastidiosa]|uniref:hypothetical protein n=1 Tax=Xylella fastidiosa TaxID=2371 RepID=UPI001300C17D|nr:hypothetical protein [Xylella fastidiosa]MBE0261566.1 hypothetical protein [Xylella fastidiosa subsp. fastidiosa]MBE0283942.1 hypothetical protein [Xylella fastidiosa subsp. fastidiosa]NMR44770.1 hypothetical protein [Xylella fastidiosa]